MLSARSSMVAERLSRAAQRRMSARDWQCLFGTHAGFDHRQRLRSDLRMPLSEG